MECRQWNALRGLPWDVTEKGAEATEAIQAPRPKIIHLPLTPRRRCHKGRLEEIWCDDGLLSVTRRSVETGLANKWSTILKVTNVCKLTNADETWNLRLKRTGHRSREKMRVIPHRKNDNMQKILGCLSASRPRRSFLRRLLPRLGKRRRVGACATSGTSPPPSTTMTMPC